VAGFARALTLSAETLVAAMDGTGRGRLQDPFIRAAQLVRHFRATSPAGGFPFYFPCNCNFKHHRIKYISKLSYYLTPR
jgi:hypothetical protein